MDNKIAYGIKTELRQKRVKMERRILKSTIVTLSIIFS